MPTPPTFVTKYETDWSASATPKTISVTVSAGDVLAIFGMTEDSTFTLATPTGGGLTYTLRQSVVVSAFATNYMWTVDPVGSSQTFTLSVSESGGTASWAYNCLRFSGSSGIGASNKTNVNGGAPSLGLTTTGANSAIAVANSDWNAVDGATRTWRTANTAATEQTYFHSASYTVYGAYHADSGAAGAKTVGLTAPTGQKYAITAVEILGSSSTPASAPIFPISQYGSFH